MTFKARFVPILMVAGAAFFMMTLAVAAAGGAQAATSFLFTLSIGFTISAVTAAVILPTPPKDTDLGN